MEGRYKVKGNFNLLQTDVNNTDKCGGYKHGKFTIFNLQYISIHIVTLFNDTVPTVYARHTALNNTGNLS